MGEKDLSSLVGVFDEFFNSVYKERVSDVALSYPRIRSVEVDYNDLERFDPGVADALLNDPDDVLEAARQAVANMKLQLPEGTGDFKPNVRFHALPGSEVMIERLSSKSLNELVSFKAVITKRTDVMHKVKLAFYRCQACGATYRVPVERNFKEPKKCEACQKFALVPEEEKSTFIDMQRAEVQDMLEKVSGGAPAAKIDLWMEDDLVNRINPGENVEIVGVLRIKVPFKQRQKKEFVYGRYVEVLHLKSLKRDFEEIEISKEDRRRILELSQDPELEKKIFSSIAPAIYGYDEVKKALALQLFGGTKGKVMKGDAPVRDDIHILLIGDPGIAKTRFLQSTTTIAPKSIYVSGKSVSGVGLTASAEKDELGDGGWTLKAGALVLSSGGMCAIDEFDKIDEEDRASLHEVMESQSVSLAKAGIVAKFKAKTAIVAAANPRHGRFNQTKNLADQFDVPPSLLSRFDLLFPITDVLDEEKDSRLAEHILTSHYDAARGIGSPVEEDTIDRTFLRKYIAYARRYIHPVLSEGAKAKIKDFYVELRRMGKSSGSVPITPRYLEGLVRLAEANAKLRLSEEVTERDADVSIGLLNYVLSKVMTDRETGKLDVDIIAAGKPRSYFDKIEAIVGIIKEKTRDTEAVEIDQVITEAESAGVDAPLAKRIIRELLSKGEIYEKEPGWIGPVNR